MGSGIAHLFTASGIEVAIGHRDPAKASALAKKIGSNAQGGGVEAAVKLVDIVLLATPYTTAFDALREAGDLTGKVLTVGHTTSAAEEIQKAAPSAIGQGHQSVQHDLCGASAP